MQGRLLRGRLEEAPHTPGEGERVVPLVELPGLVIEQILSGVLTQPLSFEQDNDEWVLVLEGRARLRVEENDLELGAGEWLLLPAGCPHTVLESEPGTNWLAVHLRRQQA